MSKRKSIIFSDKELDYDIIRSSRRTVSLSVKSGGVVIVRAPRFVPEPIIRDFIISKEKWIIKQQQRIKEAGEKTIVQTYNNGDTVPFLGQNLILSIVNGKRPNAISDGNFLIVSCPEPYETDLIKAIVDAWYLIEAKKRLIPRTFELAEIHKQEKLFPTEVSVRRMKSRWGTCRTNGKIMLNTALLKKRQELIDSVIIHELCHLKHHNHGKEFYSLVESIMPDYRRLRKELRYI